jgi:hypothetical protein
LRLPRPSDPASPVRSSLGELGGVDHEVERFKRRMALIQRGMNRGNIVLDNSYSHGYAARARRERREEALRRRRASASAAAAAAARGGSCPAKSGAKPDSSTGKGKSDSTTGKGKSDSTTGTKSFAKSETTTKSNLKSGASAPAAPTAPATTDPEARALYRAKRREALEAHIARVQRARTPSSPARPTMGLPAEGAAPPKAQAKASPRRSSPHATVYSGLLRRELERTAEKRRAGIDPFAPATKS